MYRIVSNRIRCKFCGEVVESMSVHHFVQCRCGKCFTDGGHEYIRRGADADDGQSPEEIYEDLSVYLDEKTGRLVTAKEISKEELPVGGYSMDNPETPQPTSDIPEVTEAEEAEPEKPFEPPEEAKFIKQHWTKKEREEHSKDILDED